MSIGFIGCGNMASAIICGIIDNEAVKAEEVNVFDVYTPATDGMKAKYSINVFDSEEEIVRNSDTVVLAVKPNVLSSVLKKIDGALGDKDTLLISIAAGKSTEFIADKLTHDNRIIRVMPNINAMVSEAICAYTANEKATDDDKKLTEKIFSAVGEIIYL
ncbi:MAG: NAD(P)-binding domain-containing protein, partial [Clostridia bacterium]|nr:NAD(P)-binding domain-containing protein [Clostridia bacterium]